MPELYKKLLRTAAALVIIVTVNFLIPRMLPGDPAVNLLGEDISLSGDALETMRAEMGLTEPLILQYFSYWKRILRLDFGYSFHYNREVWPLISERMGWTLLLSLPAIIVGAGIGIVLGARAGRQSGKKPERAGSALFLLIYSTPPFFLALILLYLFSFELGLFPMKGFYSGGSAADVIHHLTLPLAVLILFSAARNYFIMRGSVIHEKKLLYPLFAKSKGSSSAQVLRRHVFLNASLPLITLIALDFGFVFSGALFVEIVFSMNGMGSLLYDAVKLLDYPVLQAAFLIISVMVIAANILADIAYGLIDPRVRRSRQ
jgi:peptide/nickel transport system permease protein